MTIKSLSLITATLLLTENIVAENRATEENLGDIVVTVAMQTPQKIIDVPLR